MAICTLNGAGKMGRLCLSHARTKESTSLKAAQLEGSHSNAEHICVMQEKW